MKIAVNTRILQSPVTGIQNFIIHLYGYLKNHDQKSEYLFLQTSKVSSLGKPAVLSLPNNNIFNLLFDLFFVHFLILKHQPNIFHGPSHLLPIFKAKGTKYVLTIHDLSFINLPHIMNHSWSVLYRLLTGISIRNADYIITDSASTRDDVLQVYHPPAGKVHVIHLGLSDKFINAAPMPRLHSRPYLLSVATHPLRKNILAALKAYAASAKTKSDYDYVIGGPGSVDSRIYSEVAKLGLTGKVFLQGVVPEAELLSLYQHAALFIYPSLYEGFGFPILEAMSQRTLVLSSNVSSIPELFPDKTWLVDPMDILDIQNKMEQLLDLSDKEKTRIINENLHFSQKFTWEKCTAEYLKIFSQIVK